MKTCRFCREEYKEGATKCPHCHSDLRNWFRRHPILSLLLVIFLAPMLLMTLTGSWSSSDTTSTSVQQVSVQATPVPESPIGKHAYNSTNGLYRGVIKDVHPCNNAPSIQCYVVRHPNLSKDQDAPVDGVIVKDTYDESANNLK